MSCLSKVSVKDSSLNLMLSWWLCVVMSMGYEVAQENMVMSALVVHFEFM